MRCDAGPGAVAACGRHTARGRARGARKTGLRRYLGFLPVLHRDPVRTVARRAAVGDEGMCADKARTCRSRRRAARGGGGRAGFHAVLHGDGSTVHRHLVPARYADPDGPWCNAGPASAALVDKRIHWIDEILQGNVLRLDLVADHHPLLLRGRLDVNPKQRHFDAIREPAARVRGMRVRPAGEHG